VHAGVRIQNDLRRTICSHSSTPQHTGAGPAIHIATPVSMLHEDAKSDRLKELKAGFLQTPPVILSGSSVESSLSSAFIINSGRFGGETR
jgi:hypothetical protein